MTYSQVLSLVCAAATVVAIVALASYVSNRREVNKIVPLTEEQKQEAIEVDKARRERNKQDKLRLIAYLEKLKANLSCQYADVGATSQEFGLNYVKNRILSIDRSIYGVVFKYSTYDNGTYDIEIHASSFIEGADTVIRAKQVHLTSVIKFLNENPYEDFKWESTK